MLVWWQCLLHIFQSTACLFKHMWWTFLSLSAQSPTGNTVVKCLSCSPSSLSLLDATSLSFIIYTPTLVSRKLSVSHGTVKIDDLTASKCRTSQSFLQHQTTSQNLKTVELGICSETTVKLMGLYYILIKCVLSRCKWLRPHNICFYWSFI